MDIFEENVLLYKTPGIIIQNLCRPTHFWLPLSLECWFVLNSNPLASLCHCGTQHTFITEVITV